MRMYFFLLPFLLISCVHNSKDQKKSDSPKFYYDRAVQYKKNKNYIKAQEKLKELRKHFFYSLYNQKAVLLMADIYFVQGKYPQAVESYEKHLEFYPTKKNRLCSLSNWAFL